MLKRIWTCLIFFKHKKELGCPSVVCCQLPSPSATNGTVWTGDFRSKSVSLKLPDQELFFVCGDFNDFFGFEKQIWFPGLGSWGTSLMCMVGELVEGGSMSVVEI